jgi:hypothetical protein
MANYVFAYSGGKGVSADETERNEQYAQWGRWFEELGSAIVDGGAAMGTAKTVGPGGSVGDGGSRALTGYSIVAADSLDAAVELAKDCPRLGDRRGGRRLRSDRDVVRISAPGRIRTCDLSLRRRTLYPLSYGRGARSVSTP